MPRQQRPDIWPGPEDDTESITSDGEAAAGGGAGGGGDTGYITPPRQIMRGTPQTPGAPERNIDWSSNRATPSAASDHELPAAGANPTIPPHVVRNLLNDLNHAADEDHRGSPNTEIFQEDEVDMQDDEASVHTDTPPAGAGTWGIPNILNFHGEGGFLGDEAGYLSDSGSVGSGVSGW